MSCGMCYLSHITRYVSPVTCHQRIVLCCERHSDSKCSIEQYFAVENTQIVTREYPHKKSQTQKINNLRSKRMSKPSKKKVSQFGDFSNTLFNQKSPVHAVLGPIGWYTVHPTDGHLDLWNDSLSTLSKSKHCRLSCGACVGLSCCIKLCMN